MKKVAAVVFALCTAVVAGAGDPGPLTLQEALAAPFVPTLEVVDTISSLGPLAATPQTVTLEDLVRFHGHPCDGLVVAAAGMAYGLRQLFPNGVVDRTDLEAAVNNSACYGDAAAYLTGARHRYGSLVVDPKLGDEWILHRLSTGGTVRVRLHEGVKPRELPQLEAELRAAGCSQRLIVRVQAVQRDYALRVLSQPPSAVFTVETLGSFPYPHGRSRPDTAKAPCRGGRAEVEGEGRPPK